MNYNQPAEKHILKEIEVRLANELDRLGIFNRVFGRVKSPQSIERKLTNKKDSYVPGKKKMQDLFGVRVALYFVDDIKLARKAMSIHCAELTKDSSIDTLENDVFGPIRYNIVYRLPKELADTSLILKQNEETIDTTVEIQYRSVLSEGWHEVEHDLRYKCKPEWDGFGAHSRSLNGIYATLENCDNNMIKIFTDLAYANYLQRNWTAMIRNLFRIRFADNTVSKEVGLFLSANPNFSQQLFSIDRNKFLELFLDSRIEVPLSYDNIIFLANRFIIKKKPLLELEPKILSKMCEEWTIS